MTTVGTRARWTPRAPPGSRIRHDSDAVRHGTMAVMPTRPGRHRGGRRAAAPPPGGRPRAGASGGRAGARAGGTSRATWRPAGWRPAVVAAPPIPARPSTSPAGLPHPLPCPHRSGWAAALPFNFVVGPPASIRFRTMPARARAGAHVDASCRRRSRPAPSRRCCAGPLGGGRRRRLAAGPALALCGRAGGVARGGPP